MKIYEGLLRGSAGKGVWPRSWLVLAVQPSLSAQAVRTQIRSSGLASWYGIFLHRTKAGLRMAGSGGGDTPASFWQFLAAWLPAGAPHWIVSEHGLREWTMLGLWQHLLMGSARVAPSGPIRRRG